MDNANFEAEIERIKPQYERLLHEQPRGGFTEALRFRDQLKARAALDQPERTPEQLAWEFYS